MADATDDVISLKAWPAYYHLFRDGRKKADCRRFDRPFGVGGLIRLREWDNAPDKLDYTGRELLVRITDLISGEIGINPLYAVLSYEILSEFTVDKSV